MKKIIAVVCIISAIVVGTFTYVHISKKANTTAKNENTPVSSVTTENTGTEDVTLPNIDSVSINDELQFGKYKQNSNNDAEPIDWLVIDIDSENDQILLISKYVLDCIDLDQNNWEDCSIRAWLNEAFYESAFNSKEKAVILQKNEYNDNVFILSEEDIAQCFNCVDVPYFLSSPYASMQLLCHSTEYAQSQGAEERELTEQTYNNLLSKLGYSSNVVGEKYASWWAMPINQDLLSMVDLGGTVNHVTGPQYYRFVGVRPAMWVQLS